MVYVFAEAGQGEREAAVEALFDDAGVEQALRYVDTPTLRLGLLAKRTAPLTPQPLVRDGVERDVAHPVLLAVGREREAHGFHLRIRLLERAQAFCALRKKLTLAG